MWRVGRVVALAGVSVAVCSCATEAPMTAAQPLVKNVVLDVIPRGSPLPDNPDAACAPRNRFVLCVSEEPIHLTRTDPQQVGVINWQMQTAGWTLTAIDIKGAHRWQMGSIPRGKSASNTKDGRMYRYTITVTDGTTTLTWDPFIVND